jgi:hypothetical protein
VLSLPCLRSLGAIRVTGGAVSEEQGNGEPCKCTGLAPRSDRRSPGLEQPPSPKSESIAGCIYYYTSSKGIGVSIRTGYHKSCSGSDSLASTVLAVASLLVRIGLRIGLRLGLLHEEDGDEPASATGNVRLTLMSMAGVEEDSRG